MSAGAVIVRRQNQCLRAFRAAGATSAERARRLDDLAVRDSWVFRRMARRGVFRSPGDDRWYMDESTAQHFLRARRLRILVFFVIALSIFILLFFILR